MMAETEGTYEYDELNLTDKSGAQLRVSFNSGEAVLRVAEDEHARFCGYIELDRGDRDRLAQFLTEER
jgi:hypothetical protein